MWERRPRPLRVEGREARSREGRKGAFRALGAQRRLKCSRFALRHAEVGEVVVDGGRFPASIPGQTWSERTIQPLGGLNNAHT
jgi:hypothetical protein